MGRPPLLQVEPPESHRPAAAGVVDQAIEPAPALDHIAYQATRGLRVREIGGEGLRPPWVQVVADLLHLFQIPAMHRHHRAAGNQFGGDAPTDATGGSGDKDDLI